MLRSISITFIVFALFTSSVRAQQKTGQEPHRPQFHHSPSKDWMNDPNGMVFFGGEYHLFFQHDKYEKVFGNMSWGHAISTDLIHWTEYPDAIVPDGDSLGLIFSGSVVIDKNNTAGFGANAFVAIYTNTNPQQQQSIAYSTDKGRKWTKYPGNPVIRNEKDDNIPVDFRDPKVSWNKAANKWIMALAAQDHIEFWSSQNLKDWKKESEFGQELGSHGGVWECPDLFPLPVDGNPDNEKWVLLVSINPGGPNLGSATQYFIGDFDGTNFTLDKQFRQNLSTEAVIPPGKLFTGFEGSTYEDWKNEGNAFGKGPVSGSLPDQQKVNDIIGSKLANSYHSGDASTGKLISPPFTIESDYINLMVGGGRHQNTAVNLTIDNKIVRTATGNNSESLMWKSLSTKELKGKQARIEIIDNEKGSWGHILVDQIMFASQPAVNKAEGRWVDYGTDNYAGVTWSNTEGRTIALGWMSNWQYAGMVPTKPWRGANTIPRELGLKSVANQIYLTSLPVRELNNIVSKSTLEKNIQTKGSINFSDRIKEFNGQYQLKFESNQLESYSIVLSNELGEQVVVGYDKIKNQYYVDRSKSGKTNFEKDFGTIHFSPRISNEKNTNLTLLVDVASVEFFADNGLNVMTEIFFPHKSLNRVSIISKTGIKFKKISFSKILSI